MLKYVTVKPVMSSCFLGNSNASNNLIYSHCKVNVLCTESLCKLLPFVKVKLHQLISHCLAA